MANNNVKKISNPFSTGGGGVFFEQKIQSLFLLSLLIDGFCPVLNERTKTVLFQAKHNGYDTDDLVILTYSNHKEGKVLCQIKHSVRVTVTDKVFQEIINSAWSDFNKDIFDRNRDKIVLATAQIAYDTHKALKLLYEQALASNSETEFIARINKNSFLNSKVGEKYKTIRECIKNASGGVAPSDKTMWQFFKCFILMLFDLDFEASINKTLAISLLKCKCNQDAKLVWSRILEYSAECNQNAAVIDKNNIAEDIKELFSLQGRKETVFEIPERIEPIDAFMVNLFSIGSWDEKNNYDVRVIERLTNTTYEKYESKARSLIASDFFHLKKEGNVWRVINKEELLKQCFNQIFDKDIETLLDVAKDVYTQDDKKLGDNSENIFIQNNYNNSNEIRTSLIETICLLKKNIDKLENCSKKRIEAAISQFVEALLHDVSWIRWASLSDCIRSLAELDPKKFLKELEIATVHKSNEILKLFPRTEYSLFGSDDYICNLLWALEVLAWSPDYIVESVRCLGLLEELPYPKTNRTNSPLNSIISILLPWHPQTNANEKKQRNALLGLEKDNSSTFFEVLIKLLPNETTTTISNPKPKYLICAEDKKVKDEEYRNQIRDYIKLALDHSDNNGKKISKLVNVIDYMNEDILNEFLDRLETMELDNMSGDNFELWNKLLEKTEKVKDDEESLVYKYLNRIEEIIKTIEPVDISIKYRRLYLGNIEYSKGGKKRYKWNYIEDEKRGAIKEIYCKFGLEKVIEYGTAVNNMFDVLRKLGEVSDEEVVSDIIKNYYSGEIDDAIFIPIIKGFVQKQGGRRIIDTSLVDYDKDFIIKVISKAPFSIELYDVIKELDVDCKSYWENAYVDIYCEGEVLKTLCDKLIKYKRYITALNVISCSEHKGIIDDEYICKLLILAGTKESIGGESLRIHWIGDIIGELQDSTHLDIELLSDIEFIYLPILDSYSGVEPKNILLRLSQEPDYFCGLIEMYYKKESGNERRKKVSESMAKRLFDVLFNFKVVPGTNREGKFIAKDFKKWITSVKQWSKENDRYRVTMSTVGCGLSYSNYGGNKLPPKAIMEELNKAKNSDMRNGYKTGMINQRGVHTVQPDGKPELELSDVFEQRAEEAESMGYSRYSEALRDLSDEYKREAEGIIMRYKEDDEG